MKNVGPIKVFVVHFVRFFFWGGDFFFRFKSENHRKIVGTFNCLRNEFTFKGSTTKLSPDRSFPKKKYAVQKRRWEDPWRPLSR